MTRWRLEAHGPSSLTRLHSRGSGRYLGRHTQVVYVKRELEQEREDTESEAVRQKEARRDWGHSLEEWDKTLATV